MTVILDFLYVSNQAEVHMELSKRGIIPKLLDFIRVNDDSEELAVLGEDKSMLKRRALLILTDAKMFIEKKIEKGKKLGIFCLFVGLFCFVLHLYHMALRKKNNTVKNTN